MQHLIIRHKKALIDSQYRKLCIQIASQIIKQLKNQDLRKLGKIEKISKLDEDRAQYPVSVSEMNVWPWQPNILQKYKSKLFDPVHLYMISLLCSINFFPGLFRQPKFPCNSSQFFLNFITFIVYSFIVFYNFRTFLKLLIQMHCAIWYHLHNLKNMKNTHGVVLLLVKLQVFFTFFKMCKWYQIAQRITT